MPKLDLRNHISRVASVQNKQGGLRKLLGLARTRAVRRARLRRMTVEALETRALLTFAPAVNFPTGDGPLDLAAADVNGDGNLDIITANFNASSVSVLPGNGAGGFGPKTDFAVGDLPRSVAVGDFNSDGKQDLAVAKLSGSVSILLGNGAGDFTTPTNVTTGRAEVVVKSDFNGDGKLDLVVAGKDNAVVLIGNGTGGFTVSNVAVAGITTVNVGDFNGDGKPDLVTASQLGSTVRVLLGDGTGKFPTVAAVVPVGDPGGLVVGDYNGDNKLDVAVTNINAGAITVLLGNGLGSFSSSTNFSGIGTISVAQADFNGDGKLDLASTDGNFVTILRGNGTASFVRAGTFAVGTSPRSVVVGDFNRDGKPDVANSNINSGNVSVLLNTGEPPVITASAFTIAQGGTLVLGSTNINATDADNTPAQLTYTASGVTGGRFELVAVPGAAITSFTQAQINAGAVRFVQFGATTVGVSSFSVRDPLGNISSATLAITLANVAPSNAAISLSATPVNENSTTNIGVSFVDPDPLDSHTVFVNWGDGSSDALTTPGNVRVIPPELLSHVYKDNGTYIISVTITDPSNASTSTSASVVVNNVAPSNASITVSATSIDENGTISISGSFVDPGTLDTHRVVIDWGDGSIDTLNLAAGVLTIPATEHQYLDNVHTQSQSRSRIKITPRPRLQPVWW